MDPNTSTSGFYRSFVGNTAATTANVREGTEPDPNPTPPGVYQVQTVFDDLWDSRFAGSIQWIYDEKITVGCSATRFCPTSPVTRGQMAAFLQRAMDLPAASKDYFSDDDGKTFEGAINAIAEAGITGGCEPGRFCRDASGHPGPDGGLPGPRPGRPARRRPTTSAMTTGCRSRAPINAMAEAGLTGGCGATTFCPNTAGHPRADGGVPGPGLQAGLSPPGPTDPDRPAPHRTGPDHPVPVATGTIVTLPSPADGPTVTTRRQRGST